MPRLSTVSACPGADIASVKEQPSSNVAATARSDRLSDTNSSLVCSGKRGKASVVVATAAAMAIPTLAARPCQAATDVPASFAEPIA